MLVLQLNINTTVHADVYIIHRQILWIEHHYCLPVLKYVVYLNYDHCILCSSRVITWPNPISSNALYSILKHDASAKVSNQAIGMLRHWSSSHTLAAAPWSMSALTFSCLAKSDHELDTWLATKERVAISSFLMDFSVHCNATTRPWKNSRSTVHQSTFPAGKN